MRRRWPRTRDGDRPELRDTVKALGKAQRLQKLMIPPLRHNGGVVGAVFNANETRILTWSAMYDDLLEKVQLADRRDRASGDAVGASRQVAMT